MILHTLLADVDLSKEYKLNATKNVADVFGQPAQLIKVILPNAYIASGLVILFLLVFGGLSIIMAGGDQKGVEKGMQAIQSAIVGFLIVFTSYWIVQVVEIVTGLNILGSTL